MTSKHAAMKLAGASIEACSAAMQKLFGFPVILKQTSGRSGATSYLVLQKVATSAAETATEGEEGTENTKVVGCLKIPGGVLHNSKRIRARMKKSTEALRNANISPGCSFTGDDFYVEEYGGDSVMKDFFHFKDDLNLNLVAKLLARFHTKVDISWYSELVDDFEANTNAKMMPLFAKAKKQEKKCCPFWNLPFSGIEGGKIVMGMGNIPDSITSAVLNKQLETGVFEKVMLSEEFSPKTEAGQRQVLVHGDFKPDNMLMKPGADQLTAIDFDLTQVGPAIYDFGFMLMMWFGPRFTSFSDREDFVKIYLKETGANAEKDSVHAFMLDAEISTIVAFPGLLANIYDQEVPMLRGVEHVTAKTKKEPEYRATKELNGLPTGLELVDLLEHSVKAVRADVGLARTSIEKGIVPTFYATKGLEGTLDEAKSKHLYAWLVHMRDSNMLRLFGIAPPSSS